MSRKRIITIAAVLGVLIVAGLLFQFLFRPRMTEYKNDAKYLDELYAKVNQLEDTFNRTKPDVVVRRYKNLVQPWSDEVDERARFFDLKRYYKLDEIPEGDDPRWYYMRTAPELVTELQQKLVETQVGFGQGVNLWFDSPRPETLSNISPEVTQVNEWLRDLQVNGAALQRVAETRPYYIERFVTWPSRFERQIFSAKTYGVSMYMDLNSFGDFLNDLSTDRNTYINVNGFHVTTPNLQDFDNPYLKVDLLFTMYQYVPGRKVQVRTAGGSEVGGLDALRAQRNDERPVRSQRKRSLLDRIIWLFPF